MDRLGPASIRVTAVGGGHLPLRQVAPFTVPEGVQVEVADLGYRVNLVVTRGDEEVGVIIDYAATQLLIESNGAAESPLWLLSKLWADVFLDAVGEEEREARLTRVVDYERPASVRYPLPGYRPARGCRGGGRERRTGRRSARLRAGRSLRGQARRGHEGS
jgi:hypothetical protein